MVPPRNSTSHRSLVAQQMPRRESSASSLICYLFSTAFRSHRGSLLPLVTMATARGSQPALLLRWLLQPQQRCSGEDRQTEAGPGFPLPHCADPGPADPERTVAKGQGVKGSSWEPPDANLARDSSWKVERGTWGARSHGSTCVLRTSDLGAQDLGVVLIGECLQISLWVSKSPKCQRFVSWLIPYLKRKSYL
jgi:hypothetical protein